MRIHNYSLKAILLVIVLLAFSSFAQTQTSKFRIDLEGVGKYSKNVHLSASVGISPQFKLSNYLWLGAYFNYNLKNKFQDKEIIGPYSETKLINRYSGTYRTVDSSKTINTSADKPYGFGINFNFESGNKRLSELSLKAGLTKKNISKKIKADKTIVYTRDDEVLDESYIWDVDKSSTSKYILDVSLGYRRKILNGLMCGVYMGYSDALYGGLKINIFIGEGKN